MVDIIAYILYPNPLVGSRFVYCEKLKKKRNFNDIARILEKQQLLGFSDNLENV